MEAFPIAQSLHISSVSPSVGVITLVQPHGLRAGAHETREPEQQVLKHGSQVPAETAGTSTPLGEELGIGRRKRPDKRNRLTIPGTYVRYAYNGRNTGIGQRLDVGSCPDAV